MKTEPSDNEIQFISLTESKQTIIYLSGHSLFLMSRKSNEIQRIDTTLTEKLLFAEGSESRIWICGMYIMEVLILENNKSFEANSIMFDDKILSMAIAPITSEEEFNPILGFEDKTIKIYDKENLMFTHNLSSPPVFLNKIKETKILYGCLNGSFGLIQFLPEDAETLWKFDGSKGSGAVSGMKWGIMNYTNAFTLAVAFENGFVNLYCHGNLEQSPSIVCTTQINERITGIDFGRFINQHEVYLIVSTFGGKVSILKDSKNTNKISKLNELSELKMSEQKLITEIEAMKDQLDSAKTKSGIAKNQIICDIEYKINCKLVLNTDEAAFKLIIESQIPLDNILLQSMVPFDILEGAQQKGALILTPKGPNSNLGLCACLRLEEAQQYIELILRCTEGHSGELECIVMARNSKICQSVQLSVKPLSMHERLHEIPKSLTLHEIIIKGMFSKKEIHSWLNKCLNDMPHFSEDEQESELLYHSIVTGSTLKIKYSKNSVNLSSENLSALTILKDFISKEASIVKQMLDVSLNLNDECSNRMINLIHPILEKLNFKKMQKLLVDALEELAINDQELEWMSEEQKSILHNRDQIKKESISEMKKLNYIESVVIDLYVDTAKVIGIKKLDSKISGLRKILQNYNLNEVLEFFKEK